MKARGIVGGLIVAIVCISVICVIYDLREYEQFALEENRGYIGMTEEMSYSYCEIFLNFSRHLVFPEYQFESFEITDVIVENLLISTDTTETINVHGQSYGGLEYWNDTMTRYRDIILQNISLRYIYSIFIWMGGPNPDDASYPLYVHVSALFTVHSTFERPPKHTIAGILLNIDPEILMFAGVVVVFLPIIALAQRLWRE
ncbi:MAG: hypothetical protein ACW99G_21995 [Candidatus Thorarchaeota archaeon]|jgi:hypothetical protein